MTSEGGWNMLDILNGFNSSDFTYRPNWKLIPVSRLEPNIENVEIFNKIYNWIKNEKHATRLQRTPSGGIAIPVHIPSYDIQAINSGVELVIIAHRCYRIQFAKTLKLTGTEYFRRFKKLCKSFGINLDDYKIPNGKEVKEQIEKPMISLEDIGFKDRIICGANHIDFHQSYPGGLAATHPEFQPVIDWIYKKRKQLQKNHPDEADDLKIMLDASIGYMQSYAAHGAKWSNLSRDAIKNNNDRMRKVASDLKKAGRIIIAYNTDGIWYKGKIYHGEGEGKKPTQWENDHVDVQIRFKSRGAYEFIENGIYTPVIRGHTKLDDIKPRENWEWGDIYHDAESLVRQFSFNEETGIEVVWKKLDSDILEEI